MTVLANLTTERGCGALAWPLAAAAAAAVTAAVLATGCEAVPRDEALAGKACGPAGECYEGYVCDQDSNTCVPANAPVGGGGATSAGGSGATSAGGSGGTSTGGNATGEGSVACDTDANPCSLTNGDVCCLPQMDGAASCVPLGQGCAGTETVVRCDGPEDCPGEVCCGTTSGGEFTTLECRNGCTGAGKVTICDPNGPDQCQPAETCGPHMELPAAYNACG